MSVSCPLPKFFAVKREYGYKLYQNKVFKPTNDMIINIISNLNNITIMTVNKYHRIERMNNSILRKYYGGLNNDCSWTYSGYEFIVDNNENVFPIPLIQFSSTSDTLLPHGSNLILPCDPVEYRVSQPSIYESIDVFSTDPYALDNLPLASVVAQPSLARPPISQPQAISFPSLPAHVKNIIIADSISKKESCPISSIDIDRTNASVTSCGHVFTTDAITHWLSMSSRKECPICKQKCSI
jgi:hypothetical protein